MQIKSLQTSPRNLKLSDGLDKINELVNRSYEQAQNVVYQDNPAHSKTTNERQHTLFHSSSIASAVDSYKNYVTINLVRKDREGDRMPNDCGAVNHLEPIIKN